ncbi:MAG: glycosyltransferase family 39 protein, partial [Candidatus Omnitrophica bacterium]|nr:glycosyltransferase family 39 protein [Candidatus Omnitrophota bacterium]
MFNKTRQKYMVILLLLGVFLLFYKLGAIPLLDPDEPRYAETAREMLESKNFLIPHFNYEPRLNKPPLEYWLISLSYLAFGINEFAARFPSAVFGLASIFIVYLLGCRIYLSRAIGFL